MIGVPALLSNGNILCTLQPQDTSATYNMFGFQESMGSLTLTKANRIVSILQFVEPSKRLANILNL